MEIVKFHGGRYDGQKAAMVFMPDKFIKFPNVYDDQLGTIDGKPICVVGEETYEVIGHHAFAVLSENEI